VLAVVGARPNFVKTAPVVEALEAGDTSVRLLHTGQHYDRALSDGFIDRLGMRDPDANLGVGSGTHAEQTAGVLVGVEQALPPPPGRWPIRPAGCPMARHAGRPFSWWANMPSLTST
jgi:UDP-N-acetylglucosamine 2-epimerase